MNPLEVLYCIQTQVKERLLCTNYVKHQAQNLVMANKFVV